MKILFIFIGLLCISLFGRNLDQKKILDAVMQTYLAEPTCLTNEFASDIPFKMDNAAGPYRLMVNNLKPGEKFDIYFVDFSILDKPKYKFSGYINRRGEAFVCLEDFEKRISELPQYISSTYPGEPAFYLLVSDGNYCMTRIVPNLIELKRPNGEWVALEFVTPNQESFIIGGGNFKPNESVVLSTTLETNIQQLQTSEDGNFFHVMNKEQLMKKNPEGFLIHVASQAEPFKLKCTWR